MLTHDEFRARLKEFLGTDVFLRFVKAMHRLSPSNPRPRFWQQQAWTSFTNANPDCSLAFADLFDALRLCELHDIEMQPINVPVTYDHFDNCREFEKDRIERFPHAKLDTIMVSAEYKESTIRMWFCPKCNTILNSSRWRKTDEQ